MSCIFFSRNLVKSFFGSMHCIRYIEFITMFTIPSLLVRIQSSGSAQWKERRRKASVNTHTQFVFRLAANVDAVNGTKILMLCYIIQTQVMSWNAHWTSSRRFMCEWVARYIHAIVPSEFIQFLSACCDRDEHLPFANRWFNTAWFTCVRTSTQNHMRSTDNISPFNKI